MSYEYSEDGLVEQATENLLKELGWDVEIAYHKETFGNNGLLGRDDKSEVVLERYLIATIKKLNPDLPENAYKQAKDKIIERSAGKTLFQINKEKYKLFKDGVEVSFTNSDGDLENKTLKIFDFKDPNKNHFLAVRQLEIVGELYQRRPDVICFVNGIPLVFFELKKQSEDVQKAYTQNLSDYKDTIPHVFHCNAFIILSNGIESRIGTITSPYKFFNEWKRIKEEEEGVVSLDTMLRGTCDRTNLLDLFENFILFDDSTSSEIKILAKNHQFLGVNKVIVRAKNIKDLEGKLGVFWHTQGSGKSYSMVFITQKILRKFGNSYTFLIVADRTELENQLYDNFTGVGAVTEKNVKATSRDRLRELLKENHRYIFTLIHKFSYDKNKESKYPLLTERDNIIVLSDEAHRTQGGTFAQNMRYDAIPNATFLGFTGTPIFKEDEEVTKKIFGDYVSVYNFKNAIDDKATLPLYYINRGEKLDIDNPELDDRMAEILENEDLDEDQIRNLQSQFSRDYPVITAPKRLREIAKDLVWHFHERGYQGKAMFVAIDKPTAVKMYTYYQEFLPDYIDELHKRIDNAEDEQEEIELRYKLKRVEETEVRVIVSPEQNEEKKFEKLGLDIKTHREEIAKRDLEKEFKDPENPFRLAFVCAMWITGFDAPSISTVYLDKPIKGHTLMQTIARANRVYDDEKENGLIVDYGNVYTKLEEAYSIYGEGGKGKGSLENENEDRPIHLLDQLEKELEESINLALKFLSEKDYDLDSLINADPLGKLVKIKEAEDKIKINDKSRIEFEVIAREVLRKFNALYPDERAKPYRRSKDALKAIYDFFDQKVQKADITEVILKLQNVVDDSVVISENQDYKETKVDLSSFDFEKLQQAYQKSSHKNSLVFDLQNAVEKIVDNMVKENPTRVKFYERYKEIIENYNKGKDQVAVEKAFNALNNLLSDLSDEQNRAFRNELDEEYLAIFDLLVKDELTKKEIKGIKKIAKDTLNELKEKVLNSDRWKESIQLKATARLSIEDHLNFLPIDKYDDSEVSKKTEVVYQHIYTNYYGGGRSVYVG